jgi:hypothetical protein
MANQVSHLWAYTPVQQLHLIEILPAVTPTLGHAPNASDVAFPRRKATTEHQWIMLDLNQQPENYESSALPLS